MQMLWNHPQFQAAAVSVRNFLIQEDILIVTIGGLGLLTFLLLLLLLKTKRRAAQIQVTLISYSSSSLCGILNAKFFTCVGFKIFALTFIFRSWWTLTRTMVSRCICWRSRWNWGQNSRRCIQTIIIKTHIDHKINVNKVRYSRNKKNSMLYQKQVDDAAVFLWRIKEKVSGKTASPSLWSDYPRQKPLPAMITPDQHDQQGQ